MQLKHYFELLFVLANSEIKATYKRTSIGVAWILLKPMVQMAIIGIIFGNFIRVPIDNYFVFLLVGLLAWNFISSSFLKATHSLVNERNIIQKAPFPKETIPLAMVLSQLIHFSLAVVLLSLLTWLLGYSPFRNLGFILTSIVWLIAFVIGVSLATAALNVRYRDVGISGQILMTLLFYATPIIYSLDSLPTRLLPYYRFNPLAYPFELLRFGFFQTNPPLEILLLPNLAITGGILVVGIVIFLAQKDSLVDWL